MEAVCGAGSPFPDNFVKGGYKRLLSQRAACHHQALPLQGVRGLLGASWAQEVPPIPAAVLENSVLERK